MIQYDEKSIYIIGGRQSGNQTWKFGYFSNKTWIVDPTDGFKITEGPSLNKERIYHVCAKMTINGRTILVVAGGVDDDLDAFDSVEILDPLGSNVWTQGMFLKFITVVEFCITNIFQ